MTTTTIDKTPIEESNISCSSDSHFHEFLPGAWCVPQLLTVQECRHLVRKAQEAGIQSLPMEGDTRHRQRVTCRMELPDLSRQIWERIKDQIPQEIVIDDTSNDDDATIRSLLNAPDNAAEFVGRWTPSGLSSQVSVAYCSGMGHLAAHRDSDFVVNEHERSFLTINGFLTSRPPGSGGATRFLVDDIRVQGADIPIRDCCDVRYRVESDRQGKAVVFFHGLLHDGEPLAAKSPPKWIFRTMVLYKRDPETAPTLTSEQELARKLLKEAELAETSGLIGEAIKLYSRAYRLDPSLE